MPVIEFFGQYKYGNIKMLEACMVYTAIEQRITAIPLQWFH